ncbi:MAG: hypothetical protein HZB13_09770 [Acidobacteria bacterium]|nr:hypothetical protein [Acidobacteriota bacterium]
MKWSDSQAPVEPEVAAMAILGPCHVDLPAWMARHDVDWGSGLSPPDLLSLNRILRI